VNRSYNEYRDFEEVETAKVENEEWFENSNEMVSANDIVVDNYPVTVEDEEQVYECEKCNVIFEGKGDLKGHVYRYHEEVTKRRLCPFKQCLAEVLEHMSRNCEEDTDESDKKESFDTKESDEIESF
jgi:uncharacterized C2H2 Zn-finger protein